MQGYSAVSLAEIENDPKLKLNIEDKLNLINKHEITRDIALLEATRLKINTSDRL
jgi:spermidine synthase